MVPGHGIGKHTFFHLSWYFIRLEVMAQPQMSASTKDVAMHEIMLRIRVSAVMPTILVCFSQAIGQR